MGRPRRIIQTHYPYHITTRTNNKTFRFHKKQIIQIYAQVLHQAVNKYQVRLLHFVLMANHYHMIIHTPQENLHRFFQFVNSRVALIYNTRTGRSGHLWGGRYRSTILDTDEHYLRCVRYIYLNPVRAQQVDRPTQWDNSTFHFHAFGKEVTLPVAGDHFLAMIANQTPSDQSYRKQFTHLFRTMETEEQELRKGLTKPFWGSLTFMNTMRERYRTTEAG